MLLRRRRVDEPFFGERLEPAEIFGPRAIGARKHEPLHPHFFAAAAEADDHLAIVERDPERGRALVVAANERARLGADQLPSLGGAARRFERFELARVEEPERDHVRARTFPEPGATEGRARARGLGGATFAIDRER